jgi:LysM repeat protein
MVLLNGCTTTTTVSPGPDNFPYPLPTPSQTLCHQVQKGENLYRIGLHYGQPYEKIAQWNGLHPSRQTPDSKPVYDLQPGQTLRVSPLAGTCY